MSSNTTLKVLNNVDNQIYTVTTPGCTSVVSTSKDGDSPNIRGANDGIIKIGNAGEEIAYTYKNPNSNTEAVVYIPDAMADNGQVTKAELSADKVVVIQVDDGIARMEGIRPEDAPESSAPVKLVKIVENGITYEVDFAQGHKTGFFCDQRDNRLKFASLVKGGTVLDLCCYSGGFSIAAKMLGGAAEVTAVDLDEKAVAMARRNANINQQRIEFVHADAFVYARQMVRNGRLFDAVLLDPPKFIIGRDGFEEGIKKYHDLNMLGLQCVRPGGLFVTCSCSGLLSPYEFEQTVIKAAQRQGRKLQIMGMTGPGWDHPYLSTYPEGRYLKVLWAIAL